MLWVGLSTAVGSVADGSGPGNQAVRAPDGCRGLIKKIIKRFISPSRIIIL